MPFQIRATWITFLSFLLMIGSAGAQGEAHLTYPQIWCQPGDPQPLYFTMAQVAPADAFLAGQPSHGEVVLFDQNWEGGYYLPDPECEGFLGAGFDFFQLESPGAGLTNVVVYLGDGPSREHVVEEKAENGKLGGEWAPGGGTAIRIVEWSSSKALEGTHGFRVDAPQEGDSYLSYTFPGGQRVPEAGDNQGTVTTVIIRPPTTLPVGQSPHAEQIIYSNRDSASGAAPGTALRLRWIEGVPSVRAEARVATGLVETAVTPWCDLDMANNAIEVHHRRSLDGQDSLQLVNVVDGREVCEDTVTGFTSFGMAAAEHRFGIMEPQEGGVPFDFDAMRIATLRYETQLAAEIIDDLEGGAWSPRWTLEGDTRYIDVAAEASHTGFWGLRIRPQPETSSVLMLQLPSETSDLGCHFSLGGGHASTTELPVELLVFSARGTSGDRVRLWIRQVSSGYEIRAHNASNHSGWLPVSGLPASLDLRWKGSMLKFWIDGCGPDPEDCGVGYQVAGPTDETANMLLLGDILLSSEVSEMVAVDNVVCLRGRTPD